MYICVTCAGAGPGQDGAWLPSQGSLAVEGVVLGGALPRGARTAVVRVLVRPGRRPGCSRGRQRPHHTPCRPRPRPVPGVRRPLPCPTRHHGRAGGPVPSAPAGKRPCARLPARKLRPLRGEAGAGCCAACRPVVCSRECRCECRCESEETCAVLPRGSCEPRSPHPSSLRRHTCPEGWARRRHLCGGKWGGASPVLGGAGRRVQAGLRWDSAGPAGGPVACPLLRLQQTLCDPLSAECAVVIASVLKVLLSPLRQTTEVVPERKSRVLGGGGRPPRQRQWVTKGSPVPASPLPPAPTPPHPPREAWLCR